MLNNIYDPKKLLNSYVRNLQCKLFSRKHGKYSGYNTDTITIEKRVKNTFKDSLPNIEGLILDMGCSKGITTEELTDIFPNATVFGIDINPDMINKAKSKRSISGKFFIDDGYNSRFRENIFSAVFCLNNLYHNINDLDEAGSKKMFVNVGNLVIEGGYLLISADMEAPDFSTYTDFIILKKHGKRFIPEKIQFSSYDGSQEVLRKILKFSKSNEK